LLTVWPASEHTLSQRRKAKKRRVGLEGKKSVMEERPK